MSHFDLNFYLAFKDLHYMISALFTRQWPSVFVFFMLLSCNASVKTYKLLDNRTKVPSNFNVYKNKSKFNISLLGTVDTSVVFEEYDRRYHILTRLDIHDENSYYSIFRFYPNGCLNVFVVNREETLKDDFNPLYNGMRGVYYTEKSMIRFDFFGAIDQRRNIGKLSGNLIFSGDTLYVKRDDLSYTEIYFKRKLPPEYFKYKADW